MVSHPVIIVSFFEYKNLIKRKKETTVEKDCQVEDLRFSRKIGTGSNASGREIRPKFLVPNNNSKSKTDAGGKTSLPSHIIFYVVLSFFFLNRDFQNWLK